MNVDDRVVPPQHGEFLLWTSLTSVLVLITAVQYAGNPFWVVWAFLHVCCGVNHWRDARYGLRRDLDMANIAVGALIGFLVLLRDGSSRAVVTVLTLQAVGLLLYGVGRWCDYREEYEASVLWHAFGMHGFCNLANGVFLYAVA